MEYIDFDKWDRKEHYKFFEHIDYPQFNICLNLDVTNFKKFVATNNLSFYYSMIYASTYVMNQIEDFRYKIREGKIILHSSLQPSFTDMEAGERLFKIVTLPLSENMKAFSNIAKKTSRSQKQYFPENKVDQDQLIYFSSIPWITFTSISNEIVMDKEDSIPRISFGKYFVQDDKILLPYSIQVNHMLLDGVHVSEFINKLQTLLNEVN
ncbi:chloramphenicol O-acetyltransferase type A [Halolactibacillus halophilus]|uniref:Chloramphenicol O-acetyltransferase type A n=1 Tax=Halolactibacillus halophilus TaxID=306540 RepID=A0A1I5N6C4_9BACI|nr:chloramphenicol acetyltransferase [Halolactibacillus halophilus]GEM01217.1 chloramphenicol acetyltransferase [Halolactibacillus halophilus]SFP17429.1 chloramphenicol O-acetyltransferase type A [Halolactibacillus halophilus]